MSNHTPRITNKEIADAVYARTPFNANSASAQNYFTTPYTGHLPEEWADEFRKLFADATGEEPVYVVFSYSTPIAWYYNFEWVIPNVKYSVTTSKAQGYVRRGAGPTGSYRTVPQATLAADQKSV